MSPAARKSVSSRKECRRRSPSREPCWAGLNRSKTWRSSWSSRKESEAVDEPNGGGTEAAESESPRRHRRVLARTRCSESVREGGPGGESRRGELNPRPAPYEAPSSAYVRDRPLAATGQGRRSQAGRSFPHAPRALSAGPPSRVRGTDRRLGPQA